MDTGSISFPRFILEMAKSIFTGDLYIFAFLLAALFFLYKSLSFRKEIRDELDKMPDNPDWAVKLRKKLNIYYTVFLTIVSVFPLLGMFGTVAALLNLDFSDMTGNLDAVKNDFFRALTSTAWGIVFAVIFKLINSRISFDMEDTLEDIDTVVKAHKLKKAGGTAAGTSLVKRSADADFTEEPYYDEKYPEYD